jgi:hypothetical protein
MSSPYVAKCPKGSRMRIVERIQLERFRADWKYHHPLAAEQLTWAGDEVEVVDVAFSITAEIRATWDAEFAVNLAIRMRRV